MDIKICGLTTADDALAAAEAGADYEGFVLYAASRRGVSAAAVRAIMDRVGHRLRAVGVFVNAPRDEVARVALDCGLHAVQLHGDERPEDFAGLPVPVWRAVRVSTEAARPDPAGWQAARYVMDAAVSGAYGGTGVVADWPARGMPGPPLPRHAGRGPTPDNVAEAIRAVRPLGVDVAGGVESAPGIKDRARVRRFIDNARAAGV